MILATLLLTLLFILAGFNKISNYDTTITNFQRKFNTSLNISHLIILFVIIIEIVCPLFILYSIQSNHYKNYAKQLSYLLILFTILATLLYHIPINNNNNYYQFISNISTIGGLLLLSKIL